LVPENLNSIDVTIAVSEQLADSNSKFVSLPQVIQTWLQENRTKKIFVAGIGTVTENSDWSAFRFLHEAENILLPDKFQSAKIDELAFLVKKDGVKS